MATRRGRTKELVFSVLMSRWEKVGTEYISCNTVYSFARNRYILTHIRIDFYWSN